jgi:hypothetical protein
MVTFLLNEDKKYYDIETMRFVLQVPKAKIQRELRKMNNDFVKYKNLHLYNELTLLNLMELILIEKLYKIDGRL